MGEAHRILLDRFLARYKRGIFAHHRVGIKIIADSSTSSYFLSGSSALTFAVLSGDDITQLACCAFEGIGVTVRYLYGRFNPLTPAIFNLLSDHCFGEQVVDVVVEDHSLPELTRAVSLSRVGARSTVSQVIRCSRYVVPADPLIRDKTFHELVPCLDLAILRVEIADNFLR